MEVSLRQPGNKLKLSLVLRRFLEGTGADRELEDYAHSKLTNREEREFLDPLQDIASRYTVGFKSGLQNEAARPELSALADKLERDGL